MNSPAVIARELRHPWLRRFEESPRKQFEELLAGYAEIPPYERLDAPDAAVALFAHLTRDDSARVALTGAILDYLTTRRNQGFEFEGIPLQRVIREISEAFEIVSLLEVVDVAIELRRRFLFWNDWVANLSLSPARDARAAYWRMLALTQPLIHSSQLVDPWGLAPLWQSICRDAGARFPEHYIDLGLLGLRYLPDHANGSELPWLVGLARWALTNDPPDAKFKSIWLGLKALYPRSPQRWRKLVAEVLSLPEFVDADVMAPAWWQVDSDFRTLDPRVTSRILRSPYPDDCYRVIDRFAESFDTVDGLINELMTRHRRYLYVTGNSDFMVRAIHALGKALLRNDGHRDGHRALKAQTLAREGLAWAPNDMYLWSLWVDSLVALGDMTTAELVGWEAVRRFPENPNSRTQLAEMLIAQDRLAEASAVISELLERGIANHVAYTILARIYSNAGNAEGAAEAINNGLALEHYDETLLYFKETLVQGGTLPLKSRIYRTVQDKSTAVGVQNDGVAEFVKKFGEARKLSTMLSAQAAEVRAEAVTRLRILQACDPAFVYTDLLATRHRLWSIGSATPQPFAVSFEQALLSRDREAFIQLAVQWPSLAMLTWVARAVVGDDDAADVVGAKLREPPDISEDRAIQVLRRGLRPVVQLLERGRTATQALAEYEAVTIRVLHDSNEAALSNMIVAA